MAGSCEHQRCANQQPEASPWVSCSERFQALKGRSNDWTALSGLDPRTAQTQGVALGPGHGPHRWCSRYPPCPGPSSGLEAHAPEPEQITGRCDSSRDVWRDP